MPEPEKTRDAIESPPELSFSPHSIEGLFLQALQIESPADREAFLERQCGGDLDRRNRVMALLRAHSDAGSFLETPAGGHRPSDTISLSFLKSTDREGILGTIGPYEVLEVIGHGGMGVVLRAVDPKLNRVVAVKALLPELAANPNSRRRFLREAQAAAAVIHPHVVTIHAVDDAHQDVNGKPVPPYLVMECVIGQSLQQKLDRVGTLRLTEILRISRQVAEGLSAAHKQGLIHRDIKPANILLENGVERVKITDFGLARAIDDVTVTRTGEVSGTPQYMSPEQACGERVDHRSDLFSLGSVIYAMATGHSPFRGNSIAHVIKRVTQDTPRSITEQNPEIPIWLIEIIDCLLQKNPEQRFQSAENVVAVLEQHLSRIQHPNESGSHSAINQQFPSGSKSPTVSSNNASASKLVPMQFGATSLPVPAESASHYASVQSLGRSWILLALGGVVLSLVMHPTLSLDDNSFQTFTKALQFPATLIGIWIMMMLGTKFFHPNQVPMRTWAMVSSSMFLCMALGYFWTTVLRLPFSGHPHQLSSRTLIELAILPTIIGVLYCGYVFREITTNPESLNGLKNLTGDNSRLSLPKLLVLVSLILVVMGSVAIMFTSEAKVGPPTNFSGFAEPLAVDRDQPQLALRHPAWGEIRELKINKGGATRQVRFPTETAIFLKPEMLGKRINIHVILMDGRECRIDGFPVEKMEDHIMISEQDLSLRNQALVEVVEDAPGIKLRMIGYPSQHIDVNEFHILEAPFHKALELGEHRIVLDYVEEEEPHRPGTIQFHKLDYQVVVLDSKPLKLSLKEILERHGAESKIHQLPDNAEFKPLRIMNTDGNPK